MNTSKLLLAIGINLALSIMVAQGNRDKNASKAFIINLIPQSMGFTQIEQILLAENLYRVFQLQQQTENDLKVNREPFSSQKTTQHSSFFMRFQIDSFVKDLDKILIKLR